MSNIHFAAVEVTLCNFSKQDGDELKAIHAVRADVEAADNLWDMQDAMEAIEDRTDRARYMVAHLDPCTLVLVNLKSNLVVLKARGVR